MEERGLPFLSDFIFVQIARHLRCRELGRLARTSRRFGLFQPCQGEQRPAGSALERWTIVEEGARQRLRLSPMCNCVPRRGVESWVLLLGELERLERPVFTVAGPDVALHNKGRTAVRLRYDKHFPTPRSHFITQAQNFSSHLSGGTTFAQQFFLQSAVCAGVDLRAGSHFIEFAWVSGRTHHHGSIATASSQEVAEVLGLHGPDDDDDTFLAGVCSPSFDPTDGSMASNDCTASLFSASSGRLRKYLLETEIYTGLDWPGRQCAVAGDVIGLLLDLDEGSLAVYPLLNVHVSIENLRMN